MRPRLVTRHLVALILLAACKQPQQFVAASDAGAPDAPRVMPESMGGSGNVSTGGATGTGTASGGGGATGGGGPGDASTPDARPASDGPAMATCPTPPGSNGNCGRCGRTCDGDPCRDGLCPPTRIASGILRAPATAYAGVASAGFDGQELYFLEAGKVMAIAKTGGVPRVALETSAPVEFFAVLDGHIYWSGVMTGGACEVLRIATTGGQPERLAATPCPLFMRFSKLGDVLYWLRTDGTPGVAESRQFALERLSLSARKVERIAGGSQGIFGSVSARFDDAGAFWIDNSNQGQLRLRRAPLTGGESVALRDLALSGTLVHSDAQAIYWLEGSSVKRMAKDGSGEVIVLGDLPLTISDGGAEGMDLVLFGFNDAVLSLPLSGGAATVIAPVRENGIRRIVRVGLGVDDRHVYWISQLLDEDGKEISDLWRGVR